MGSTSCRCQCHRDKLHNKLHFPYPQPIHIQSSDPTVSLQQTPDSAVSPNNEWTASSSPPSPSLLPDTSVSRHIQDIPVLQGSAVSLPYMCSVYSSAKQSHTWSPISSTMSLHSHSLKLTDMSTETPCSLIIYAWENHSANRVTIFPIGKFDYISS